MAQGGVEREEVAERPDRGDVVDGQGVVVTAMPPTQCLIMRANSLSMTNCPQSKVTPDSIIPEP